MPSNTSTVLATIGTILWCIQMIPQIWANYRRKNTEGFPEAMCLLWCLCAPFFAVFLVSENAGIALMIQPHLFGLFCFIVYLQVMYYPPVARPRGQIIARGVAFLVFQVCLEVGFIIPLRKLHREGVTWPTLVFGIIASVILALGLIPPYFELAKRGGRVVGINFVFLSMDFLGAVFSLASLVVDKNEGLDVMGCILYSICASLELGIFVSHAVWLVRTRVFGVPVDEDELDDHEEDEALDSDSNSVCAVESKNESV